MLKVFGENTANEGDGTQLNFRSIMQRQNYDRVGEDTTQPQASAAQNGPQPQSPPPSSDWQTRFLQELAQGDRFDQEHLFAILELVKDFHERIDPTTFMGQLLQHWIVDKRVDLNAHRLQIDVLMDHLLFLNHLREAFYCFNAHSHYIKISESEGKEMGHE